MNLKNHIRNIPDFPKPGILYRDITPLLGEPEALQRVIDELTAYLRAEKIEAIAAVESRGFIFGTPVACRLGVPFVPVRKPGKLPYKTLTVEYSLEYGSGQLDIHEDSIKPGARVAIIDDLLATGGTAAAAGELVRKCGGIVAAYAFVIELTALAGRKLLGDTPVHSLMQF